MNTLLVNPIDVVEGEILLPDDMAHKVRVIVQTDPFSQERHEHFFDPGDTLLDILLKVCPAKSLISYMRVYVGEARIYADYIDCVRPKPGSTVIIRAVPRGGDKDPLRILASIALLALAFYVPSLLGLGGIGIVGDLTVGGLVTAGILVGGTMLLNSLFPPPTPKLSGLSKSDPTFLLSGARNSIRPYSPIPRVLGTIKQVPPLGALPYTEVVGDKQFLRMIFVWGYGPLDVTDMKIGETSLDDFDEVEIEHLTGVPGDPTEFTLFSNSIFEESQSVPLVEADSWQQRTSKDDADELSIDVTFLRGLVRITNKGKRRTVNVSFEVQYADTGTTDWKGLSQAIGARTNYAALSVNSSWNNSGRWDSLLIDVFTGFLKWVRGLPGSTRTTRPSRELLETRIWLANVHRVGSGVITNADIAQVARVGNEPFGDPFNDFLVTESSPTGKTVDVSSGDLDQVSFTVRASLAETVRRGFRWEIPTRGKYDVRVRRVTPDSSEDNIFDEATWTALRTITNESPISFDGLTATALRIRATEQLNGVVDNLSGVCTSIIPDWDGTNWINRAANNPASCFLEVLRGSANKRPLPTNYALSFDGTDNVNFGDDVAFDFGTDSFTIEYYVIVATTADNRNLVKKGPGAGLTEFRAGINPGNRLDALLGDDAANKREGQLGSVALINGVPYHVAFVFDRINDFIYGYIDGILVSTPLDISGVTGSPDNANDLILGATFGSFIGQCDDLRIWNDARTQAEIHANMGKRLVGDEVGLIGYWPMNEGGGSVVADLSSGGNDGTIDGATWILNTMPNTEGNRTGYQSLQDWHDFCVTQGFAFNMTRDYKASVEQALRDIASAGRATLATVEDNKWGVIWDDVRSVPIQHFSPRNTRNYNATKLFPYLPHAFRVIFQNEDKDYAEDERLVYDDMHDESNATIIERLELIGITDADSIWKHGRYHIAQVLLRPEDHTFDVDIEYLVAQRGELIKFIHDVPKFGVGSARILVVNDNGSEATSIVVNDKFPVDNVTNYAIRARAADGTSIVESVTVTPDGNGETDTLTFVTPPTLGLGSAPEVGDLILFGELEQESVDLIIKSIKPLSGLGAQIVCVDYSPAVLTADTGEIPDFDSHITEPAGSVFPAVVDIRSDEDVLIIQPDGSWSAQIHIVLVYSVNRPASAIEIQARYRRTDTEESYRDATVPISAAAINLTDVAEEDTYDIQLRYLLNDGNPGIWSPTHVHTVIGAAGAPPDVLVLMRNIDQIDWDYPDPPGDFAGFHVRHSTGVGVTWEQATPLHRGLHTESHFSLNNLTPYGGAQTILVKAIDVAENESDNPASLVLDLGDALIDNVVITRDLNGLGFPGVITNGTVEAGPTLEAIDDGSLYLVNPNDLYLPEGAASYLPVAFLEMIWETQVIIGVLDFPGEITLIQTITGQYLTEWAYLDTVNLYINNELDSATYLPVGTNPYLLAFEDIDTVLAPWPGKLSLEDGTERGLKLQTTIQGSGVKGTISDFDVITDVPDEDELVEDLFLLAAGTRVPLVKTYRSIKVVNITLQDDGGTAAYVKRLDKDPVLGPLLKAFDSSDVATTASVDVTIQGIRG